MRIDELQKIACRRRLDRLAVMTEPNLIALTGIRCDNAILLLSTSGLRPSAVFYTDFRYVPMVHRTAPGMKVADIRRFALEGGRIGYESSISHARFLGLRKLAPRAKFVDISEELAAVRAVKTDEELGRIRAAEKLNCDIWKASSKRFRPGMTEKAMARIIRTMMTERGDGEAFNTIVCVGKNAAECHHEPDDTVWDGIEPVLVDMGVRLNGVCSDLTRNLVPEKFLSSGRAGGKYREIHELVKRAHDAAISAARPGMTAKALDKVARDVIRKAGYGKAFGHSLGHGVGYEIHESPTVSVRNEKTVLRPGMVITIEPGIYLEGELGVRIEDMVVITDSGCELLSES